MGLGGGEARMSSLGRRYLRSVLTREILSEMEREGDGCRGKDELNQEHPLRVGEEASQLVGRENSTSARLRSGLSGSQMPVPGDGVTVETDLW